ncbi:unnamed protein product [uncultured bacterium]|nr:unnamed protein product [uncultured bacterium]
MVLRDRDTDANGTLDERLWVQQDASWNVTALLDGIGAVIERYVYDPFGVVKVLDANWAADADGVSDVGWLYSHQGGRYDPVSGLYYFRNRDYSATLGRFTSLDPILFGGGDVNLYRWIGNSPANYIDPLGLYKVEICYKLLGQQPAILMLPGQTQPLRVYHAYIVVTDTDGSRYYFRAGPYRNVLNEFGPLSASSNPTVDQGNDPRYMGGPFGTLWPQYGPYLPGFSKKGTKRH